jgi:NTE family protein
MKNLLRIFPKRKTKWALVLMGGGARGLAHIGVLDVLQKKELTPDIIVGTSMGAIIGGFFAAGFSLLKLREMAKDLDLDHFIDRPNLPFLPKKPYSVIDFMLLDAFKTRLLRKVGHESEDKLEEYFKSVVGEASIEDLPIRFACNAVDLVSGKEVVFDRGKLYKGLRATMSLPIVFEPLRMDEMILVDGGVLNNAPVEIARDLGAERIVLVDVHRPLKKIATKEIRNTFQLIQRMVETMTANMTEEKIKAADLVIRIELDVDIFDFSNPGEVIEAGELAVNKSLDPLKKWIH